MNNPHESKLWAGYFLVMCAVVVLDALFGDHGIASVVNTILSGVSLVGLWGYISKKALGSPAVWRLMLAFQVLGTAVLLVVALAAHAPVWVPAIGFAFAFPLLLALYRYAFRSRAIWATSSAES